MSYDIYIRSNNNPKYICDIFNDLPIRCNLITISHKGIIAYDMMGSNEVDELTYVLPVLYKIDSKGKDRMWKVLVQGNTTVKIHGIKDSEKLLKTERSFESKSVGKSNETTPREQAMREADRDWVKQIDKGYEPICKEGLKLLQKVRSIKNLEGNTNTNAWKVIRDISHSNITTKGISNINITLKPMQCSTWSEENKCLKYFDFELGVYIQPKLDGVRGIASLVNDNVILTSRTSKQIAFLENHKSCIKEFLRGYEDIVLDGEIYVHNLIIDNKVISKEDKFNIISGACRPKRKEPHDVENKLCYYVFDIISDDLDQTQRTLLLDKMFSRGTYKYIRRVPTHIIHERDDIDTFLDIYYKDDYEGVIIRSHNLMYEQGKRSLKIRKYKNFIDFEATIVGIQLDPGVDKAHYTFVCEHQGNTFNAKPRNSEEQRLEWYKRKDELIGLPATIKCQSISDEGIPRFPIFVCPREEFVE